MEHRGRLVETDELRNDAELLSHNGLGQLLALWKSVRRPPVYAHTGGVDWRKTLVTASGGNGKGCAMRVTQPSADELRAERKRLLARPHAESVEELEQRVARGGLSSDEYLLWEEIRSINFLLGEDDQVAVAG